MSEIILIYGSGGLGVEILDLVQRTYEHKSKRPIFVDDINFGQTVCNIDVIDFDTAISQYSGTEMIIANGEPEGRLLMFNKSKKAGFKMPAIIDDTATISNYSTIGEGSIVCAKSTIAARSMIGKNVLINIQTIVGHDVEIMDNTVLASMVNIGGASKVGDGCMLGMGVTVRPKTTIGGGSLVAFSSSVFSDLPENVIAVGNPARVSRKNEKKAKS